MEISWQSLYAAIDSCERCGLWRGVNHRVPGQGSAQARVMFIGEGPGRQEDLQGLAFVGDAGQLLTRMIEAMGLTREEVYICNIVKCRPPYNRTPTPEEAASCLPFLRAQFALIRPRILVLLGATAARSIIDPAFRITSGHGQWHQLKGVWVMPTYHPSALLRDPSKKKDAWADLKQVMEKMRELGL